MLCHKIIMMGETYHDIFPKAAWDITLK